MRSQVGASSATGSPDTEYAVSMMIWFQLMMNLKQL